MYEHAMCELTHIQNTQGQSSKPTLTVGEIVKFTLWSIDRRFTLWSMYHRVTLYWLQGITARGCPCISLGVRHVC